MRVRRLPTIDYSPVCLRVFLLGAVLRMVLDSERSYRAARRAVIRRLAGKAKLDQQRVKDAFAGRNGCADECNALWRALGFEVPG